MQYLFCGTLSTAHFRHKACQNSSVHYLRYWTTFLSSDKRILFIVSEQSKNPSFSLCTLAIFATLMAPVSFIGIDLEQKNYIPTGNGELTKNLLLYVIINFTTGVIFAGLFQIKKSWRQWDYFWSIYSSLQILFVIGGMIRILKYIITNNL